jgi:hypothetical protein
MRKTAAMLAALAFLAGCGGEESACDRLRSLTEEQRQRDLRVSIDAGEPVPWADDFVECYREEVGN